ncbi:hypothetical protein ES332_A13G106900v1 [Gossypium tomentosum]|uniref:Uncharacterized protein n=1 Tax=Gossypium tomentosum TaxID=34277 RepID=A0A5D2MII7_GOSTO|nr:hypothetical protein ES332_A13G106900v1 [Gossypium tomentosum]
MYESHSPLTSSLKEGTVWASRSESEQGGMFTVVVVRLFISCSVFQKVVSCGIRSLLVILNLTLIEATVREKAPVRPASTG